MLNLLFFSIALSAAAPVTCPDDTVCIVRDAPGYSFRFTYPRAAAHVPGMDAVLREQATETEARLAAEAATGAHDGPLRSESHYRLDADLPEIIAVTGTIDAYDGHRMSTVMVDPRNGERLDLIDLFHPETFDNVLFWSRIRGIRATQDSFCHALSETVRARRAELQLRELDVTCPDIEDQPVTTICNGRGRILAMRAFVTPAATRDVDPEAPRAYTVDFDMTAEMIGVMKERYRVAFGLPGETRGRGRRRTCPAA
jgi:hypothetical protein